MNSDLAITIQFFVIENVNSSFSVDDSVLSPDEMARAQSFKFDHLRQSFVSSRYWLRNVLGHVLACSPDSLQFRQGKNGKPQLVEPNQLAQFNFSRSQSHCVCAVTHQRQIGVDIELNRQLNDMELTAGTIFDELDLANWQSLPADLRDEAFFRAWTRKEAIVKANGVGISQGVKTVKVPVGPDPLNNWTRITNRDKHYLYADMITELNCPLSIAVEVAPGELPIDKSVITEASQVIANDNTAADCLSSTRRNLCTLELQS